MTDAGYQHDENGQAWGISCNKERRMNLIKQIRMLNEVWNVIGLVFVSFFTYIYVGDLKIHAYIYIMINLWSGGQKIRHFDIVLLKMRQLILEK